jgi:hypothetical protein
MGYELTPEGGGGIVDDVGAGWLVNYISKTLGLELM